MLVLLTYILGFTQPAATADEPSENEINRKPGILYPPSEKPVGPQAELYLAIEKEFEEARVNQKDAEDPQR